MNRYNLKYFQYNNNSLLISWPERIDQDINNDVNEFKIRLETGFNYLLEVRSSYCSLLLIFNKKIENLNRLIEKLKNLYLSRKSSNKYDRILWNIPVCYENKFALDIDIISKQNKISKENIIIMHSKPIYSVYLIGFLPGFMYLGGLDVSLHIPRRKEPRLRVPKGSVAIGGEQTSKCYYAFF